MADAIHIATYYIGNILIEANERMPSYNNASYRPTSVSRRPTYQGSSYVPGYSSTAPSYGGPPQNNPPQQLQTQQIYIPNDLVGCIIGKGGAKINEIRHMSASQIKIMEPGAVGVGVNGAPAGGGNEGERLVVITGQPNNIQMAVQLLYHVSLVRINALGANIIFVATGAGEAKADARLVCTVKSVVSFLFVGARPGAVIPFCTHSSVVCFSACLLWIRPSVMLSRCRLLLFIAPRSLLKSICMP